MTDLFTLNTPGFCTEKVLTKLADFKDKAELYHKVSNSYHVIDSRHIINSVGHYLQGRGFEFTVDVLGGAGTRSSSHINQFTLTHCKGVPLDWFNGEGQARILIPNSYNGERALCVMGGFYRFACANGIIVGQGEFFERIIHVRGQTIIDKIKKLDYKIEMVLDYLENKFQAKIEEMKNKELNFTEAVRVIKGLNLSSQVALDVILRRHPDNIKNLRSEDRPENLWCLFNIVNEVIRNKAKSELSEAEKNYTLMDDITSLVA